MLLGQGPHVENHFLAQILVVRRLCFQSYIWGERKNCARACGAREVIEKIGSQGEKPGDLDLGMDRQGIGRTG